MVALEIYLTGKGKKTMCQTDLVRDKNIRNLLDQSLAPLTHEQRWYCHMARSAVVNAEKKDMNEREEREQDGAEGRRTQDKNANQT